MSILNILHNMTAYNDTTGQTVNNNPKFRIADWSRQYLGLTVENAQSQVFVMPPNSSLTLYDGSRNLSVSSDTTLSITNTIGSTYRVTYTGGTNPGFRTQRAIATSLTTTFNVVINNNSIVSMTQNAGPAVDFSAVQVGDLLYVGNDSLFNVANQGVFPIVAKGSNYVQFQNVVAVAESNISLSTNYLTDFLIYSSSGVQVGDTAALTAGFSPVTLGTYEVSAVTPLFFEFLSSDPLPLETGIQPGASGLAFYTSAKFFTYIETDQDCFIRFDADGSNIATIEPFAASNGVLGMFMKSGTNYRSVLTNRSLVNNCNVYLFTAQR